jgi:fatty acid desaturase
VLSDIIRWTFHPVKSANKWIDAATTREQENARVILSGLWFVFLIVAFVALSISILTVFPLIGFAFGMATFGFGIARLWGTATGSE